MRLQLLVGRMRGPIEEVFDQLSVMMSNLEAHAELTQRHADHLDIHPMSIRSLVVAQIQCVAIEDQACSSGRDQASTHQPHPQA